MFVDAIFDVLPAPFAPVAYILMTGKTDECYLQAFNWLFSAAQDLSLIP